MQLQDWKCVYDILVNGELHTLKVRQSSIALRSVNLPMPLPILGPTEELVMTVPKDGITVTARSGERAVPAEIEAWFLLRDFPEI